MDRYVISPNLPKNKVSVVLLDARARKTIVKNLEEMGIRVILTDMCNDLYDAVSYHPDMFIHHLGDNCIVAAPNAPLKLLSVLEGLGFNIIKGQKPIGGKYPGDIAYNVARIDEYAVCSTAHTDKTLLQCLYDRGVKIVDVKQGYSKCSLSIIERGTVITSDEGLYTVLRKHDFNILKISPGSIDLKGLDYGFIGGASGLVSNEIVAFAGNLSLHPDLDKIEKFLSQYGKQVKSLDHKKIMDVGTIIPLKEYCIEEIC